MSYIDRRPGGYGRNYDARAGENGGGLPLPDGTIHMKTQPNKKMGKWAKVPLLRGVVAFVSSLVEGTKTLMYSADVLEANWPEEDQEEPENLKPGSIPNSGKRAPGI